MLSSQCIDSRANRNAIRVGIVGIGFMGMIHYRNYQRLPGVKVVAICGRNPKHLAGDWRDIRGNFGPTGSRMDLSGVKTYSEIDDLLSDSSIDLIDITLPPSLHAQVAIRALEQGKHVLSEKPMALKATECDQMIQTASRVGKQLMVGHVLPFFPEFNWALRVVRSQRYGQLIGAEFKRVVANPIWVENYWCEEQVGGPMFDLHVHDAHFIRLLCGMPKDIITRGSTRQGLAKHWYSIFDYGDDKGIVSVTGGILDQQARSFLHGFEIRMEKATLVFEFAIMNGIAQYLCPPTILNSRGRTEPVMLPYGDPMNAFQAELREVVRSVHKGRTNEILRGELARDAIILCDEQMKNLRHNKMCCT